MASGSYQAYHGYIRAVGIKTLKNRLSEYVRLAASGEPVLILDRETVVAELVPPAPYRARFIRDARWAELIRSGIVTPAAAPLQGPPENTPSAPLAEILRDLDHSREDRSGDH